MYTIVHVQIVSCDNCVNIFLLNLASMQTQDMPLLKNQAVIFLSAPAASVFSEQIFSDAGNIYCNKRNKLLPERAECLIFLHRNLKKLNFDY